MTPIRNAAFYFFSIILLGLFGLSIPVIYILKSKRITLFAARVWAGIIDKFIKIFLGIHFDVEGNIPDLSEPHIIISNHQSAWETIVFYKIFQYPSFIAKKELRKIPIFGWFIEAIGFILIDRSHPRQALAQSVTRAKEIVKNGQSIIIFPEGTRVPPDETVPFQSGYALLYKTLQIPALIVAHNSGCLCSEDYLFKYAGNITVKIVRQLPAGIPLSEFTEIVESTLNAEKKSLVERFNSEFWRHALG